MFRIGIGIGIAGLLTVATSAYAINIEPVVTVGKRVPVAGLAAGDLYAVSPAPVMNDAGQVAVVLRFKGARSEDDSIDALVLRERGRFRLIARSALPVPGHRGRVVGEFTWPLMISADGGVIFNARLVIGDAGNRRDADSLWHYDKGKLHLLMAEDERIGTAPDAPYASRWTAVVANNGCVTALGWASDQPGADNNHQTLVAFKDGKVQLLEYKKRDLKYGHLHAAGDHTIVMRQVLNSRALNPWEMCRVVDGQLQPFARYGQEAPQGMQVAGRPTFIHDLERAVVTPGGRVLLCVDMGHKGNPNLRPSLILSEPNFGAFRGVAMHGEAAGDSGRTYANLARHADRMAASDDGHVIFGDNAYFYMAMPDGRVEQIAAESSMPGLGDRDPRVFALGVANGGYGLIHARAEAHCVYAWDPKRKLTPLFTTTLSPPRLAPGLARVMQDARSEIIPNALTPGGKWLVRWDCRTPYAAGLTILDVTR